MFLHPRDGLYTALLAGVTDARCTGSVIPCRTMSLLFWVGHGLAVGAERDFIPEELRLIAMQLSRDRNTQAKMAGPACVEASFDRPKEVAAAGCGEELAEPLELRIGGRVRGWLLE